MCCAFLSLLFSSEELLSASFGLEKVIDGVTVKFLLNLGFLKSSLIDDAMFREADGFLYCYSVLSDSEVLSDFRKTRKRIGKIKGSTDCKVMLLALVPEGSVEEEEEATLDRLMHEAKILAGNYATAFSKIASLTSGKRREEALKSIRSLTREMEGKQTIHPSRSGGLDTKSYARELCLVFVGDMLVGKTALIQKFVFGQSLHSYSHTNMIATHNFAVENFRGQFLNLKIMDTPSICNEKVFNELIRGDVLSEVHGFVLMYSVRNANSFKSLQTLFSQTKKFPVMVIGTNADERLMRTVAKEEASSFCRKRGIDYREICCFDDLVVADVLTPLLDVILGNEKKKVDYMEEEQEEEESTDKRDNANGILFLTVRTKKRSVWYRKNAEINKGNLHLTPDMSDCANEPQEVPVVDVIKSDTDQKEKRRSGFFSTLKTSFRNSVTGVSMSAESLEMDRRTSLGEVTCIQLSDCLVSIDPLNIDTGRHPFSIIEATGKQYDFEVESLAKRDEWIKSIKKASIVKTLDLKSDQPMISGGNLSRKRAKSLRSKIMGIE